MVTVLQTTWQKAVVVRIRARHVFVLGAVLANLSLVALPRVLALDPDRRISQYGHTVWRVQDSAISPYQYCSNHGVGHQPFHCGVAWRPLEGER